MYAEQVLTHLLSTCASRPPGGGGGSRPGGGSLRWLWGPGAVSADPEARRQGRARRSRESQPRPALADLGMIAQTVAHGEGHPVAIAMPVPTSNQGAESKRWLVPLLATSREGESGSWEHLDGLV